MATLIRKDQIRTSEFIQPSNNIDWTSNTLAASAAAIAAKIQSEITGVTGAMMFRGDWDLASSEDVILSGYVYVYNGHGTPPTGVVLEIGDTLIAKQDNPSVSNANHWTVVQVNIVGAITETNLVSQLNANMISGNTSSLSIGIDNNKIKITAFFPTITNGAESSGDYVSGLTIDSSTGVISVKKAKLSIPIDYGSKIVFDQRCNGETNGVNKEFTTQEAALFNDFSYAFYINGVKQTLGADYTASIDGNKRIVFTITNGYVPRDGDEVFCSYLRQY